MTERQYAVAIDGPSGAGKSTLARAAAEALHILYVDTGAIYRTIGVYMYRHDIAPTDAPAVIAALPEITVALRYDEEGLQRMYLNGEFGDDPNSVNAYAASPADDIEVRLRRVGHTGGAGVPDGAAAVSGAGAQRHHGRT